MSLAPREEGTEEQVTVFPAHVPSAGYPHYGLDKAGVLFWCYVLGCCVSGHILLGYPKELSIIY